MKILFISYVFPPSTGGIETTAIMLLEEFARQGLREFQVVTHTLSQGPENSPWPIHRRPGPLALARIASAADLIYQHNPSLRYLWPSIAGKPTVISIHAWMERSDGSISWRDKMKKCVLQRFTCISNSHATAKTLPFSSRVIPNAYNDRVFRNTIAWTERRGAAFVGRLVSSKGLRTALQAISMLRQEGCEMPLQVIGDGPEADSLRRLASQLSVSDLVLFHGTQPPNEVAGLLNSAKYLLVPSLFESFGLVALEGIACGCIPVTTGEGGLSEAVGPCGPFFAKENPAELAKQILDLERNPGTAEHYRSQANPFLSSRTSERVAAEYLKVFRSKLGGNL